MQQSLDWELLAGLRLDASDEERRKATAYFEELRNSDTGWLLCAQFLLQGSQQLEDSAKYFCLQVIEHRLRCQGQGASGQEEHDRLKHFLSNWAYNFINSNAEEKSFVRNKVAQLYSLAFVRDFPHRWPLFVDELASTLGCGERAVDLFLRVLLTIDADVVDREIPHTAEEAARNASIKDALRTTSFLPPESPPNGRPQLADIWFWILTTQRPQLVCLCLEVISLYVSWIDIGLIANDRFAQVLLQLLRQPLCREAACGCLASVVAKGMPPEAKVSLVESYAELLERDGLLRPAAGDGGDYLASLGKLVAALGSQLLRCRQRLGEAADASLMSSVEAKMSPALSLLANEDDDVSQSVIDFCQEFVGCLKSLRRPLTPSQLGLVHQLLATVVAKVQYDDGYDPEAAGEEEAMFDEYRRDLKSLFGNLVALDPALVTAACSQFVANQLPAWRQATFAQTEAAVYLLYLLGEFVTPSKSGDHFCSGGSQAEQFTSMMACLCNSGVSHSAHPLVSLRYFETVVRYEKFFLHNAQFIPDVLMSFLDERGLHNKHLMVRSRVSYLLSRFVKCHKNELRQCTEQILQQMQDFLQPLSPPENEQQQQQQQQQQLSLSPSDRMFLFETAAILIVSSGLQPQQKRQLFESLLSPVLSAVQRQVQRLLSPEPALAADERLQSQLTEGVKHNIDFVSRTSKAFSGSATMAENDCAAPFAEITGALLQALALPDTLPGRARVCTAVRSFLHRMVICLDTSVLPFVPMASAQLLRSADAQDLHDFYALLSQLVARFKSQSLPYVQELLSPLLSATLVSLSELRAVSCSSRDPGCLAPLRKGYCAFLACLVANGLGEALDGLEPSVGQRVLASLCETVAQQLADDPGACKLCVGCVRALATGEAWRQRRQQFVAEFVVSCLRAPAEPRLSLADAQVALFLAEVAQLLLLLANGMPEMTLQCAQSCLGAAAAEQLMQLLLAQTEAAAGAKQVAAFLKKCYQCGKS